MWTTDDTEHAGDVAQWAALERASRRRRIVWFVVVIVGALALTWCGSQILFGVARSERAYERERARWLEENRCRQISHREDEWTYHYIGDWWEHVPGETCWQCAKIDERICEPG